MNKSSYEKRDLRVSFLLPGMEKQPIINRKKNPKKIISVQEGCGS